MSRREPLDRLYALVANEEDARTCRDISEEACREVPGNFFKIMITNTSDKCRRHRIGRHFIIG